jgi:hypothetical protein
VLAVLVSVALGSCIIDPDFDNDCDEGAANALIIPCWFQGSSNTTAPPRCDVIRQDCADPTQSCYAWTDGNGYCYPTGTQPTGASCANLHDCVRGDSCPGDTNTCRPACSLGDAGGSACTTGTTCKDVGTGAIGACG